MAPSRPDDRPADPVDRRTSVWTATSDATDYPPLSEGGRVDVAVVGGGIAGLTAAAELADDGRSVAVVERDRIAAGATGNTTAKVTSQHGVRYHRLREDAGERVARAYAAANEAAIDHVEATADELGVDCGFHRLPAYAYTSDPAERRKYEREAAAAADVGLPATAVDSVPVPDDAAAGVRFDAQAEFHPRSYLLALAESMVDDGVRIYEGTRATDIDDGGRGRACRVETDRGTLAADSVVVATHFPIVDPAFYFARMSPKKSYVVAVDAADPPDDGVFYRAEEPYLSVRTCETDEHGTLTLVGGQNHKTGQGGSTAARFRRLERQARARFDVESVAYRWSTEDFVTLDGRPYVGELERRENVYVATGFGGWGMTNGVAAGRVIADLVRGRRNSWARAFDPARVTDRGGVTEFLTENANVGKQYVSDWAQAALSSADERDVRDLSVGEGTVVRDGTDVLAVSRSEAGYDVVSGVCPHLGCVVSWNDGEATWDCPCHGSRFESDGEVLDGPAVDDLSTKHLRNLESNPSPDATDD
ncbi:FAD-dependent oxidoreductase [Candidatus Halobonum tyrrellensis]|uniref:Glycine/D-amino acid oxidase, deaminating n=1 Tax=Candidatus Halobonum tyrrellensis G22 TaxID=1324957 RepID=V4IXP5_9EURY|nr:FAD-dependent oxidoreductase [Candidatus Halobonum tyrrellensis]ESP87932.1 glycine/D-amino acid oxidase, deaminating [Candidatus Halobonum tyrrellensis G22]